MIVRSEMDHAIKKCSITGNIAIFLDVIQIEVIPDPPQGYEMTYQI